MSSSAGTQYETLYGVQLLDDLHNYFPAVLYDSNRFRSVGDLLFYLQTNARNRFDLFSFGQRNYLQNTLPPAPVPLGRRSTPDLSGGQPPIPLRSQRTSLNFMEEFEPSVTTQVEMVTEDLGDIPSLNLMNLMNVIAGLPAVRMPSGLARTNFMEPVPVRPTQAQINRATTLVDLADSYQCSICLANIETTQPARRIHHCRHTFHSECFDGWFRNNVTCPVCRHDLRETDDTASTRPNSTGSTQ